MVGCWDTGSGGPRQAIGGFFVGDYVCYSRVEDWGGGGGGIDEGLEVGAGAGDEDEKTGAWRCHCGGNGVECSPGFGGARDDDNKPSRNPNPVCPKNCSSDRW